MASDKNTPGEVTVWWASITESAPEVARFESLLDSEERARAERFRVEAARHRFVTGRVMLRQILSSLTGVPPGRLTFTFGEHGKPQLEGGWPCFNLAHSGDSVVLAVADDEVGVDVEERRDLPNAHRLVSRICTPREAEFLLTLPEGDRNDGLLRLWTAKEAVLKTLGTGIAGSMRSIEVSVADHANPRLVRLGGETVSWSLLDVPPPDSAVAAAAVPRPSCRLETRRFQPA